ncbi:DUF7005 family protein [Hymenobacter psychrophilus]|uniref:Uncharacterized protein n=1 Tax=Hymenobacter psychrophilus TaxID=651662 RepID=A0A1H3PKN2_9BACT|nr:hypothetical protein [Hymenobacter psychrophilus]SDZ01611.1 hypothetical protein SAMN04488069_1372 [Hymenobacter psychrophilus]
MVSIDAMGSISDKMSEYFLNRFCETPDKKMASVDEHYVRSWEGYAATYREEGAFQLLKTCYPQLNFHIQEGINKTQDYIDVVLKGKSLPRSGGATPLLNKPEGVRFTLHESIAGKVPVLTVADNEDFVKLVQCLLYKNNPTPVPHSMGALLLSGINNWDRIKALKTEWQQNNPSESWNQEFSKNILPNPGLYKDKLIILSTKPYSAVSAEFLGLSEADWMSQSLTLRLEHECTHLYTLSRYGCASNNLHDELVADYIGISNTIGFYSKEWMLAFIGLEGYPNYRQGGRLENYVNNANLTLEDFRQLIPVIKCAIENIASFDAVVGKIHSVNDQVARMNTLCTTDLLDISSPLGSSLLIQKYRYLFAKAVEVV